MCVCVCEAGREGEREREREGGRDRTLAGFGSGISGRRVQLSELGLYSVQSDITLGNVQ